MIIGAGNVQKEESMEAKNGMTLQSVAKKLLQECDMDLNTARQKIDAVLSDGEYRAYFQDFVRSALENAMRLVWIEQRNPVPSSGTAGPTESALMSSVMKRATQNLMKFPLWPSRGLYLEDATRPEILAWCAEQRKAINTQFVHVLFAEKVAERLKNDEDKVKTRFRQSDLERFMKNAERVAGEVLTPVTA
jgi:hypothetical protein